MSKYPAAEGRQRRTNFGTLRSYGRAKPPLSAIRYPLSASYSAANSLSFRVIFAVFFSCSM
jgi:hypothetical protein